MEELVKKNKLIIYFDSLDVVSKWKIYCKYLISYYSLKYSLIISINKVCIDNNGCRASWKYDYSLVKKRYNLTRKEPVSFDDFCSHKNLKHVYIGDSWEKQGFAQKEWIEYLDDSLYYWGIKDNRFNNILNWL